ncbi:MAG: isoaspartyl peptidase/L-asparaginase [Chlorobi bacterium]|nr:isoaspartyl peptidase/L-asparaginase [Chlorobiota bacterium]
MSWKIVIHGGAGNITPERIGDREEAYRQALTECVMAGAEVLKQGGSAIDAVVVSVKALEDNPLFNAGKGSVPNEKGIVEMDAAVMDGKTLNAGAVTMVKHIKNPILLALKVMQESEHVLLGGEGAEEFALEQGFELVENRYFITEERWKQYVKKFLSEHKKVVEINSLGTVGSVAVDKDGNVAAATSTGGLLFKHMGRIGDTPLIGAGTYADNEGAAVSTTGLGEFFIRTTTAFQINILTKFGTPIAEAVRKVLQQVKTLGGTGGVIAINKNGEHVIDCVSPGIFSAVAKEVGNYIESKTFLYKHDL